MSVVVPDGADGRGVLAFAWWSTGVFAVTAIIAAIWPTTALRVVAVVVALLAFGIGLFVFLGAYFRAIGRSRYELVSVAGVYLLMGGVAPRAVRRSLLGALAVQVVVALVTASVRLYSSLAFGVLVPLLGVALCGWWSATHGAFAQRSVPDTDGTPDDVDDGDSSERAESAGE
jgi:hypothetical protein